MFSASADRSGVVGVLMVMCRRFRRCTVLDPRNWLRASSKLTATIRTHPIYEQGGRRTGRASVACLHTLFFLLRIGYGWRQLLSASADRNGVAGDVVMTRRRWKFFRRYPVLDPRTRLRRSSKQQQRSARFRNYGGGRPSIKCNSI